MAKTAVAKKPDAGLPSYLADAPSKPVDDNFTSDDLIIPRLKLLQGTSEEVTTHNDAQAGSFWNTAAGENLGSDIEFVVAARNRKYLLIAPMDDGQGVLARAPDAKTWDRTGAWKVKVDKKTTVDWVIDTVDVEKSGLAEWGTHDPTDTNESPPAATLIYDYLVLVKGHEELGPMVLSLARSAIKAGKDLNTKIRMRSDSVKGNIGALVFSVRTDSVMNAAGQDYFVPVFGNAGFAEEGLFKAATESAGLLETYIVEDETDDAVSVVDDDDDTSEGPKF